VFAGWATINWDVAGARTLRKRKEGGRQRRSKKKTELKRKRLCQKKNTGRQPDQRPRKTLWVVGKTRGFDICAASRGISCEKDERNTQTQWSAILGGGTSQEGGKNYCGSKNFRKQRGARNDVEGKREENAKTDGGKKSI